MTVEPGWLVEPSPQLQGSIKVPGDKSVSHRSLMLGGIAEGITEATGFLDSADCLSTMAALQAMGVRIERPRHDMIRVHGAGAGGLRPVPQALDMGNAGTAMRLFMGLLAGQGVPATLVGDSSLMKRPMERVARPLREMGATITTSGGLPPVVIHAASPLHGIDYTLPMASAQVKSAILLAGLNARGTTRVTEPAPTRDHTERMLQSFGVRLERQGATVALEGGQALHGTQVRVPGDISSAAFFLVAGCLAARDGLTIRGVGVNPTRTGLVDMLRLMGADLHVQPIEAPGGEPLADITVRAAPLRGVVLPPELVPLAIDELPVFFIAAACAEGQTTVTGAAELRVKESDRLAVMAEGLQAVGVSCELLPDGMRIQGGGLRGGRVHSHGDHRIAMAFAVAGTRATEPIRIDDVANVGTSFPGFAALARSVGLAVQELPGGA